MGSPPNPVLRRGPPNLTYCLPKFSREAPDVHHSVLAAEISALPPISKRNTPTINSTTLDPMKPNPSNSQNLKAAFAFIFVMASSYQAMATNISGDTVTTNLTINGNTAGTGWGWFQNNNLYLGANKEMNLRWAPASNPTTLGSVHSQVSRADARFWWIENGAATLEYKMLLNESNILTLYKPNGTTAGITISPDSGIIDIKGTAFGGLYSNGVAILAVGSNGTSTNLTVSSLTTSGDSYVGGIRIGKGNGGVSNNTALGYNTLISNTTGDQNSASGALALGVNTSGGRNTANGSGSLFSNTAGSGNTAVGSGALYYNVGVTSGTAGSNNTAIGDSAGVYFGDTGGGQLNAASYGIYIGAGARGASFNDVNAIVIGATAVSKGSNTTVIGTSTTTQTYLAGQTISNTLNVTGQAVANSLSVTGATVLNGQVTLAVPQGDISMGIYGN